MQCEPLNAGNDVPLACIAHAANLTQIRGSPPSLFWESDVGKWIEATTYFLASTQSESSLTGNPTTSLVFPTLSKEFEESIDYLIDLMEKAQKPDGYLNIYFTVVDPKGRMMNLRDYHEMYNSE